MPPSEHPARARDVAPHTRAPEICAAAAHGADLDKAGLDKIAEIDGVALACVEKARRELLHRRWVALFRDRARLLAAGRGGMIARSRDAAEQRDLPSNGGRPRIIDCLDRHDDFAIFAPAAQNDEANTRESLLANLDRVATRIASKLSRYA